MASAIPHEPTENNMSVATESFAELFEQSQSIAKLRVPKALPPLDLRSDAKPVEGVSNTTRERYLAGVERIREYILAGDAFQVQLGRRIAVPHDFPSDALYRALRALNPSPYMYHLVLDGVELVGSSPELLLRVSGGRATVRPIAGTRPRGATPEQDAELVAELVGDEKESAEHVMLVDLGRNDIGRVARYGTVEVSDYKCPFCKRHQIQTMPQLMADYVNNGKVK